MYGCNSRYDCCSIHSTALVFAFPSLNSGSTFHGLEQPQPLQLTSIEAVIKFIGINLSLVTTH